MERGREGGRERGRGREGGRERRRKEIAIKAGWLWFRGFSFSLGGCEKVLVEVSRHAGPSHVLRKTQLSPVKRPSFKPVFRQHFSTEPGAAGGRVQRGLENP